MRASWYAKALYGLTTAGKPVDEKIVENFVGVVAQNGHAHMLQKIIRLYAHMLDRHKKRETIEVVTAVPISETDVTQLLRKEPLMKLLASGHRRVQRNVDPSIIGGVIVRTSNERTDMSYKHMLIRIYQEMTSNV